MKTNRINVIMKTDEHLERLISIRQNVHNTVSDLISQDLAEIYKEKIEKLNAIKSGR